MTTSISSEALNIVDKINYREDFQLINVQYFLEITKPFLNMHDGQIDGQNKLYS